MTRTGARRANEKTFSLQRAIAKMAGDRGVEERRDQLVAALGRYPRATLRDDSQLAYQFIAGEGDGHDMTAESVAAEMASIQQLYSETEYGRIVQRDLRLVATWAKANYPAVSWSDIWSIVRETFAPACKLEATKRLLQSRRLKESAREAPCDPERVAAA